jgi:signal transduction histidine kinase
MTKISRRLNALLTGKPLRRRIRKSKGTAGMAEAESGFWSRRGIKPWLFESLAENAARVCGDSDAIIFLKRNGALRHMAHYGSILTATKKGESGPPIDDRRSVPSRAFVDGQTVHVHDVQAGDEFPLSKAKGLAYGVRTSLAMPLLHEGVPMGVILMRRTEVLPFSDKEIALVKIFVNQAARAFENGQLFREIDARNHDLAEALAQQTATAEILRVIASSPTDLEPVLKTVAESAARICEANDAVIFRIDGQRLRGVADYGPLPGQLGKGPFLVRLSVPGRCVLDCRTIHVHDLPEVPKEEFRASFLRSHGTRTVLATPMLRKGTPIGVIMIRRTEVRPFSDRQIALLETFADQAVIAIENVRLFQELQDRNGELRESLTQQTATSEILRVIASSPTDLQPVLNSVAENAARVCGANDAVIFLIKDDVLWRAAVFGSLIMSIIGEAGPRVDCGNVPGRAVIERRTIHVHDLRAVADEYPGARGLAQGVRTELSTPLLREGEPIGVILIRRTEVRPFTEKQIDLLKTFADQAVIAIENVRLFQEIQNKNRQLEVANERLQELDRLKSDFVANVSHELRTPLTAIKGAIDLLLREVAGPLNEKQTHYLARVRSNTHRLAGLINDVLDLSRIEEGKIEFQAGLVSLAGLVREVVETLKPIASEKEIVLQASISDSSLLAWADRDKVMQVLTNLIGNAVKFASTGGCVTVSATLDGAEWVRVSVIDDGPGISQHEKDKIFEKFYQVADVGGAKPTGTGLGLSISKAMVELHGGKIWVESALNRGSAFHFTLPASAPDSSISRRVSAATSADQDENSLRNHTHRR